MMLLQCELGDVTVCVFVCYVAGRPDRHHRQGLGVWQPDSVSMSRVVGGIPQFVGQL